MTVKVMVTNTFKTRHSMLRSIAIENRLHHQPVEVVSIAIEFPFPSPHQDPVSIAIEKVIAKRRPSDSFYSYRKPTVTNLTPCVSIAIENHCSETGAQSETGNEQSEVDQHASGKTFYSYRKPGADSKLAPRKFSIAIEFCLSSAHSEMISIAIEKVMVKRLSPESFYSYRKPTVSNLTPCVSIAIENRKRGIDALRDDGRTNGSIALHSSGEMFYSYRKSSTNIPRMPHSVSIAIETWRTAREQTSRFKPRLQAGPPPSPPRNPRGFLLSDQNFNFARLGHSGSDGRSLFGNEK